MYESYFAIPGQLRALGRPWPEIAQAYLDAHAHSPERAEPLYALGEYYASLPSNVGPSPLRYKALALVYLQRAVQLPYPTNAILWVQADVYRWQAAWLLAQVALDLKMPRQGAAALHAITSSTSGQQAPPHILTSARTLVSRYVLLMGLDDWTRLSRTDLFTGGQIATSITQQVTPSRVGSGSVVTSNSSSPLNRLAIISLAFVAILTVIAVAVCVFFLCRLIRGQKITGSKRV